MTIIYQPTTTIAVPTPWPSRGTDTSSSRAIEVIDEVNETETGKQIVIEDIRDIAIESKINRQAYSFISLIGVTPTPGITGNLAVKLSLSVLLSAILSIWISNTYLLGIFAVLSLTDFFTSAVWDKNQNYRTKVSRLVADFLIIAVSITFIELIIGKIQIPYTQINISLVAVVLYIIILNYLFLISKRLFPLTSLAQSKTWVNLILAFRTGIEDFQKRQEKEVLNDD